MDSEEKKNLPRRKFFINGIKAVVGFFGLSLSIPLAGFFISPVLKKNAPGWIEIADVPALTAGEPVGITYKYARKDGWEMSEIRKTAFVLKQADGNIAAFSNRCTHLGCGVTWDPAARRFKCPCHGGVFDAQGKVLEGPPPKPLAQLAVKVEANKIFINEA